jgi:hypothetical protein
MPAESQNLVAYGKVLAEATKTVTEYNIKDGDFIVVMVKKVSKNSKDFDLKLGCDVLN